MKPINPDVVNYLIQQDQAAIDRVVASLIREAQEIVDRAKVQRLDVHHLQSAQASITDLTYRLTRLRALKDTLPTS